ncbi:MAG: hypothetical protein O9972_39675 [Burkholderiales bacterium]|nr:hypothetical protein [Burkholderiales bacterium]
MTISSDLRDAFAYHRGVVPAPIRAAGALSLARRDIEAGRKRYGAPSPACLTWQPGEHGLAHIDDPAAFGLRHVGDVNPESFGGRGCWNRRGERGGWHTDPHGDVFKDGTGLCWGVVYQLPGRNGRARFVAGYEFGGTDCGPTLDLGCVYEHEARGGYDGDSAQDCDMARAAARCADDMARVAAEDERAYQAACAAGTKWAELGDDVIVIRRHALALGRERRAAKGASGFPTICETIREAIAKARARVETIRAKRERLAAGDGEGGRDLLSFWSGDKRLREAFNEGAGRAVLS